MAQPLSQPPKNNSRAQLSPSNYAFLSCASLPHSHIHMYTFSHMFTHMQSYLYTCAHMHTEIHRHTHAHNTHTFMPSWSQDLCP